MYLDDKNCADEYRDPTEFFHRTYLTVGLKDLLTNALTRLSGKGGDPVIELQTNFGGGKTHAMLALYHLCFGVSALDLPGCEAIFTQTGIDNPPKDVNTAVLVGNKIDPGTPEHKKDGTVVKTLSESAKNADNTLLVVSIPASDIEIGGEKGFEALNRLKNAIGRVESPWLPASAEESFHIVRRRLFKDMVLRKIKLRRN